MEAPPMQHLFNHEGEAALAAALRQSPLLAFDFDGTLAPIVAQPDDARISQAVSARLKALATQLPLAIVTGRTVDDVRGRLGFEPRYIVGNHGAEDPLDPAAATMLSGVLEPLRERLRAQRAQLSEVGVVVEDKGASLALHYRLSRQRERALALISDLLAPQVAAWRVFGGKMVVNIAPRNAPNKASAVRGLVARCGTDCAVYAGDDLNDEPVFESAPPHWLTVRIGRDERRSSARFFLDSPCEMAMLLERMLVLLPSLHSE
jgi:trehalose 6-phosphate phosphatase